ncbi:siderophore-interacting protein [Bosea sp. BIWAKO-01]|uniref:siderophore-interacting protein n=1 Tax=Bosea sp. BIWAKO-01 TaxID=506668 RepID=UPI0008539B25|nr:siderophore-interacting protein [Bosea sp. BIWAKO-01]GAU86438.1 iron-chelator utilization protein [Bosea sp. BIWAKO-01]
MTENPFHEATLVARRYLTPGMIRLTFSGEGLNRFRSTGIPDEYIRLFFPDPATGELVLPTIDAEGRWVLPEERQRIRYSTYTVRSFDSARCELEIDLVVHDGGKASDWARDAEIGARIVINNPRGLYARPDALDRQILIADATGLPAVARILEQTPEHVASRVFIEVADETHEQPLPDHRLATTTWFHCRDGETDRSRLIDLLASEQLDDGRTYLWAAAEKAVVRTLRAQSEELKQSGAERQKIVAYWAR